MNFEKTTKKNVTRIMLCEIGMFLICIGVTLYAFIL